MKNVIRLTAAATLFCASATTSIPAASAKGCLRGAVAGGVVGHYARRHTIAGAMAGCVAGHYYYKHKAAVAARSTPARR